MEYSFTGTSGMTEDAQEQEGHISGYAGARSVYRDARPRRESHGHGRAGGGGGRFSMRGGRHYTLFCEFGVDRLSQTADFLA